MIAKSTKLYMYLSVKINLSITGHIVNYKKQQCNLKNIFILTVRDEDKYILHLIYI